MIQMHETVLEALKNQQPIVALESTIISHGMPYPDNIDMVKAVGKIIRDHGAVPATIAIINGVIKVGLSESELEYLATSKEIIKASKRDLGYLIASKKSGATTVSATMIIAEKVGIKVFATGGIGGVHRGAETSFDISRDLEELSQTDVAVVCAGIKSILNLGLTLEYLETKGVEIIGYQTDLLPAFYTRTSAHKVTHRLDSVEAIASLMFAKWNLGLAGGIVVANPIPEAASMDETLMNQAIDQAILDAEKANAKGKENTPFLLAKVKEITEGKSLNANLELVYNNAKVAAQLAVAYQQKTMPSL